MSVPVRGVVMLTLCGVVTPVMALEVPPVSLAAVETEHVHQGPTASADYGLTGDWFGFRDRLTAGHVYVEGAVILDAGKVLRGGMDTEAWPVSYLADLSVTVDLFGLTNSRLDAVVFANLQSHDQSENGDAAVGDVQGYNNVTASRHVQVAQFWYKQTWGDVRLKIGKMDANADAGRPDSAANDAFSLVEHGLDFLHSAASYTPTMFAMPSYPGSAPGVVLFLGRDFYAGAGAFYANTHQTFLNISGHPEKVFSSSGGMFVIGEVGARWHWDVGGMLMGPGHAGVGGWYHSGRFPRVDGGGMSRGTGGGYAFIDQTLFHDEQEGRTTRDVGFFLSVGLADKTTSGVDQSITGGLSASGWIPYRPDDSVGVMASWAHLPAQSGLVHSFELATEVYYRIQLTPWASLKPSFAYIVNPGGTEPDAAVMTLRTEIDF